jgi:hypothetical protein
VEDGRSVLIRCGRCIIILKWTRRLARIGTTNDGGVNQVQPRMVEEGQWTFTDVLIGKGHEKELGKNILGTTEIQPLRKKE